MASSVVVSSRGFFGVFERDFFALEAAASSAAYMDAAERPRRVLTMGMLQRGWGGSAGAGIDRGRVDALVRGAFLW